MEGEGVGRSLQLMAPSIKSSRTIFAGKRGVIGGVVSGMMRSKHVKLGCDAEVKVASRSRGMSISRLALPDSGRCYRKAWRCLHPI